MTATLGLVWLTLLGCTLLVWNLVQFGTPRPQEFAAILGICFIGSIALFVQGMCGIRSPHKTIALANVLLGLAVGSASGVFVYQTLANEDAMIPIGGQAVKPKAPVTQLRLFNLNVLHGYPDFEKHEQRFRATAALLTRLDADVLVLQEVWNTNQHGHMAERLAGHNFVAARANGSRSLIGFEEGSAILSRFPILESRRIVLKPRWPLWENRIALLAKLDLGNETLTVVGVHLSVTSPDEQSQYLAEVMRAYSPDIIAGDWNAQPDSRAVQAFRDRAFTAVMPVPDAVTPRTGPVIDHVFLSEPFRQRWHAKAASWIMTSRPDKNREVVVSDHDGILVDLQRR